MRCSELEACDWAADHGIPVHHCAHKGHTLYSATFKLVLSIMSVWRVQGAQRHGVRKSLPRL